MNYNPSEDKLILLGDYVDRGLKSKDVVEQVKNMVEEWGVIALRGNHDQMMLDSFYKGEDSQWLNNGGYLTVESYCGSEFYEELYFWDKFEKAKEFILKNYKHHLDFLNSLPLYHENNETIFVHAGINPLLGDWKNTKEDDFIWIRELFYTNPNTNTDKTVVFGHTPAIHLHETEDIWFSPHGDKIGLDGGCCFGLQLNCLEINDTDGYKTHFVRRGEKIPHEEMFETPMGDEII